MKSTPKLLSKVEVKATPSFLPKRTGAVKVTVFILPFDCHQVSEVIKYQRANGSWQIEVVVWVLESVSLETLQADNPVSIPDDPETASLVWGITTL